MVTVLLTSDLTEIHTFYFRIDIFHGRSFLTEISLYLEVKKNPKRIRHSPKNVTYSASEEKPFSSIFMKSTQIKYFFFFIVYLNLKTLNISVSPEKVSENMFTIGQFNHTIDRQEPIPKFKSANCPSYFSKRYIQSAHN